MKTKTITPAPVLELGSVSGTRSALSAISDDPAANLQDLLGRHQSGDWGDVSEMDAEANEEALLVGARVMSVYKLPRTRTSIWIITEGEDEQGHRHNTTVLLPTEY